MIDSVSDEANKKFKQAMGAAIPKSEPATEPPVSIPPSKPMIVEPGASVPDLKRASRTRYTAAMAPTLDRLPPHAPDMEQGVLGSILLSPNDCMGECIEKLKMGVEAFFDLRHQTIFKALAEMYDARQPIDVITLQQKLKDKQLLEQVGGIAYISGLPDVVPSAANLSYYLDIVKEKYVLRTYVKICTDVVTGIYNYEGEVEQLMDEVERELLNLQTLNDNKPAPLIKNIVVEAVQTIEDYHARQGRLIGLSTGFSDLDKITGGLANGEMIVIAARPSMGKTALAMNIVDHIAVENKIPVGVFSLEMTRRSLVMRMICSRARVNLRTIQEGFMADRDLPKITSSASKLAGAPIHINDESGLSILQLRSKARRMVQQFGCKVFVIDYLQLLNAMVGKNRVTNRRQEIGEISNGIKALAKELDVPVIVLSQLSRDMEKGSGKKGIARKPKMADLKESGDIEQDADLIGLLYKPERDDDIQEDPNCVRVKLDIAKQRNGPTGEIDLTFLKVYTRFENAAKVSEDDIPGKTTLF